MIQNGLTLTGSDAELLSRVLEEVKAKSYQDSEIRLDDTQSLNALVSCFKAHREGRAKYGTPQISVSPKSKGLFLGTISARRRART